MITESQFRILKECLAESNSNRESIEKFKTRTNIQLTPYNIWLACKKYSSCLPSELMRSVKNSQVQIMRVLILPDILLTKLLKIEQLNDPTISAILFPSIYIDETKPHKLRNLILSIRKVTKATIYFTLAMDSSTYKLYGHLYSKDNIQKIIEKSDNVGFCGNNSGLCVVDSNVILLSSVSVRQNKVKWLLDVQNSLKDNSVCLEQNTLKIVMNNDVFCDVSITQQDSKILGYSYKHYLLLR